jgi:hypothetical protein
LLIDLWPKQNKNKKIIEIECVLPTNQEKGQCVPLSECNELNGLLKKSLLTADDVQLLSESQCDSGNDVTYVCCSVPVVELTAPIEDMTEQIKSVDRFDLNEYSGKEFGGVFL